MADLEGLHSECDFNACLLSCTQKCVMMMIKACRQKDHYNWGRILVVDEYFNVKDFGPEAFLPILGTKFTNSLHSYHFV